jgi:uncharacterized iron-regulated membrane protein
VGDELVVAIILGLFVLAVLGGIVKWWRHRRETRAWLSGEDRARTAAELSSPAT